MSLEPTETTLATILWAFIREDDALRLREVVERAHAGDEVQAPLARLIQRGHVVYRRREKKYALTDEGREWIGANRALVADAVLESARKLGSSFVFSLAVKPTQTTRKKS